MPFGSFLPQNGAELPEIDILSPRFLGQNPKI